MSSKPQHQEAVAAFVKAQSHLLGSLWGRWQDEKEYEDINEYGKRLEKEFPEGWKLLKTTKRPFGVHVQIGSEKWAIKVTGKQISWTMA